MKRFLFCILLLAGLGVQVLPAQRSANAGSNAVAQSDRLSDDDGGVVQIVPPNAPASIQIKARVAPVMKSVRQVSIFLGAAWAEPGVRVRERDLSDLSGKLAELQNNNVMILPAAPSVEDFSDLTKAPVNDLTIQHKLTEMLNNKAIPLPTQERFTWFFWRREFNHLLAATRRALTTRLTTVQFI